MKGHKSILRPFWKIVMNHIMNMEVFCLAICLSSEHGLVPFMIEGAIPQFET